MRIEIDIRRDHGQDVRPVLEKVFKLHRGDYLWITLDKYRLIKPLAVALWRETLRIVGLKEDVLKRLKEDASISREMPEMREKRREDKDV